MISDVPGLTWGTVAACAQAGVKYFSLGNNFIDGGRTLPAWEDKPFYWLAPRRPAEGSLLAALPGLCLRARPPERHGESAARAPRGAGAEGLSLRHRRICGGTWAATTARPTQTLSDVVKNWNAKHASPKLVIATDQRVVPRVRGTLCRQDSRRQRRFHAVLGERGLLVGPRNGPQSHGRRAAGAGRDASAAMFSRSSIRPGSSPRPGGT